MPLRIAKHIDNDTIINLMATNENCYYRYDGCSKCLNFNVKDIEKIVPRPDCSECNVIDCTARVFPIDKTVAERVKKEFSPYKYSFEREEAIKERYKRIAIKISASFLIGGIALGAISTMILRYLL